MSVLSQTWTDLSTNYVNNEANIRATAVATEIDRKWKQRISELIAIRRYRDDWDGCGSDAPKKGLVDAAVRLMQDLRDRMEMTPPTACVASSNGSIIVIWQRTGAYFEAEITPSGEAEWMSKLGSKTQHWTEYLNLQQL